MEHVSDSQVCKACGLLAEGAYCADCGRPRSLKRIDGAYVIQEIGSILNFDKGLLYTIKQLLIHPGETVKTFITSDRNRLVKPVLFIVISSLVYSLFKEFLHFEDKYANYGGSLDSSTTKLFQWVNGNYGYANLMMGLFIAFWTRWLFRKAQFNFFEILILLCFVMGMGMLILALFGIVEGLSGWRLLQAGSVVFLGYTTWAIGQFFDGKKAVSYVKALAAYLLGMISFSLLLLALGAALDRMR